MVTPLMATYNRLAVTFTKGEGVWLWDTDGNKYLDAVAGVAVCNLGHAHPAIAETICGQAKTLVHTSNLYGIEKQQQLGEALTSLAKMDRVFFCNSGAEANEAAIKLARLYGNRKEVDEPTIIVMENSFHGRTLATLTATGNRKVQAGFEPLVRGFLRVPYGDIESIEAIAASVSNVVAILVEPAQGEGGVNIPTKGYLQAIRSLCDDNGWLMMLDEIQTGMGRTGKMFACEHEGVTPDVMTLAKGLGNGMPIGACLANGQAAELFGPGSHGSTFGGNPLACAVALNVIEIMTTESIPEKSAALGNYIVDGFQTSLEATEGVVDIRAIGCLIGIELNQPCGELVNLALEKQLLINVTAGNVVRLIPPLTMSSDEADILIGILSNLIKDFLSNAE